MYLWLKRWLYGCNHEWTYLTKCNVVDHKDRHLHFESTHRCYKCMKLKKDKI